MTLITISPNTVGSLGLPQITILPAELTINQKPSLKAWFDARAGISGSGTAFTEADRHGTSALLGVYRGASGPVFSSSAVNGQPALSFQGTVVTSIGELADVNNTNVLPTSGDFSLVWVAKNSNLSSLGSIIGNTDATNYCEFAQSSGGNIRVQHQITSGTVIQSPTAYTTTPAITVTMSISGTATTIGGTPTAGNKMSLTVNSVAYTYTLLGNDTLATAATALAALINAATPATASGSVITTSAYTPSASAVTAVAVPAWHTVVYSYKASTQTSTLRVNGATTNTATTQTLGLSNSQIHLAAAGGTAAPHNVLWYGSIALVMVFSESLFDSDNTFLTSVLEPYLRTIYATW